MASPANVAALLAGYRTVLRVHRTRLPPPMRELGDQYVRTEFRAWAAARAVTPAQWREFGDQWRRYVDMLLGVADSPEATSGDIPPEMLGQLNDEQKAQLDRLRVAVMSGVSSNDNST
jgi:hypothetical protein